MYSLTTSAEYFNDFYGRNSWNITIAIVIMKMELKKRLKQVEEKTAEEIKREERLKEFRL